MYYNKINGQTVRIYSAFSLVEILISLSLGAVLLLITAQFYVDIYRSQYTMREWIKLQQNSHQLLNYIQQHVQHIGYLGQNRDNTNYDMFLVKNRAHYLPNPQCFIFFYDLDRDGCIGSRVHKRCQENGRHQSKKIMDEFFSIKLYKKHLYYFTQKLDGCLNEDCQRWVQACDTQRGWKNSTQLVDYVVDNLSFKWKQLDRLLEINLTLSSIKMPSVKYTATAYSYVLNWNE